MVPSRSWRRALQRVLKAWAAPLFATAWQSELMTLWPAAPGTAATCPRGAGFARSRKGATFSEPDQTRPSSVGGSPDWP